MQVSDQLHAPTVLQMGKEPLVISLNRRLDGLQNQSGCYAEDSKQGIFHAWPTHDLQCELHTSEPKTNTILIITFNIYMYSYSFFVQYV